MHNPAATANKKNSISTKAKTNTAGAATPQSTEHQQQSTSIVTPTRECRHCRCRSLGIAWNVDVAPLVVCSAWGAAMPQSMTLQTNTHRVEKMPRQMQQQQQQQNQCHQVDQPSARRRQEQQHNTDNYGCSNSNSVFFGCQHAQVSSSGK